MKTGLGIYKKVRFLYSYFNLFRFYLRKYLLGFDVANIFLQRIDKISLQLIIKKNGATIGNNCDVESGQIFHNCKNYKNLIIGNNCHIGKNCFFDLRSKIIICNNVVISMQCSFITHIDINKSELSTFYPSTSKEIIIHDNSYIGANSIVLMGVTVDKMTIIAANSLVIKNVSSYSIFGGVPVKKIKDIK